MSASKTAMLRLPRRPQLSDATNRLIATSGATCLGEVQEVIQDEEGSLNERVALAGVQFVEMELAAASSTIECCRDSAMTSNRTEFMYAQNALDLGWRVLQSLNLPEDQRTQLRMRITVLYEQLDALAANVLKPAPITRPAYSGLFKRPIPINKGR